MQLHSLIASLLLGLLFWSDYTSSVSLHSLKRFNSSPSQSKIERSNVPSKQLRGFQTPMKSGNILVTQPNEVFSHNFLVEIDPTSGDLIQFFDLQSKVQPVDIRFHPKTQQLLLLDFQHGNISSTHLNE